MYFFVSINYLSLLPEYKFSILWSFGNVENKNTSRDSKAQIRIGIKYSL